MRAARRALLLAACILASQPIAARADNAPALPTDERQVQDQLSRFDPAAVAAARHYYESPKVKDGLLGMLKNLTPTIIANQERASGKKLSSADRAKIAAAIDRGMSETFPFLIELNIVAAVEVLSKDQLIALDQFYNSPMGQSILDKMPLIGQRLPAILQVFLPKFTASVQAAMAAPAP